MSHDVSDVDVDIDLTVLGPHYFAIEVNNILGDPKHPPRQIDDELVMRMKRPIDLPDEDYQPDYATDYNGLVGGTSTISLTSRHHLLSTPRGKHRECAPVLDARPGFARCSASSTMEPPDNPRRSRSFGHARH
ncbi:hypothetical protein C0993_009350 [Termitomyces sp. T159_Od127]|nr:hypothetical protein C0993_009350 [Termitomyces sp. T159_Od127]